MAYVRQIMAGLLAGLVSLIILLGVLSLALAEGNTGMGLLSPTFTETASPLPTIPPGAPTFTPSPMPSDTATPTPTQTCAIPPGWIPLELKEGDSLAAIAQERGLSLDELLKKNCLTSENFLPETILHVPPFTITPATTQTSTSTETATPTPTNTPVAPLPTTCIPSRPPGWTTYIVQSGDTLFAISQAYYTTVFALQQANCISGSRIITGQTLFVPNVATRTPIPLPTSTATISPTLPPPTDIPTSTPTFTPTQTLIPPTNTPTDTSPPPTIPPTPTDTVTPIPPTPTPAPSP